MLDLYGTSKTHFVLEDHPTPLVPDDASMRAGSSEQRAVSNEQRAGGRHFEVYGVGSVSLNQHIELGF